MVICPSHGWVSRKPEVVLRIAESIELFSQVSENDLNHKCHRRNNVKNFGQSRHCYFQLSDISHMTCSRDHRGTLKLVACHFTTADSVCELYFSIPRLDF